MEELALYDEVIDRFGGAEEPEVLIPVARSTKGSSVITLQVLDGTVAFILSGSSATLKQKETLAQKMLSLV